MIRLEMQTAELADFIGSTQGLTDVIQTPIYLDDVLRIGHAQAARHFDQETSAYAAATQKLNHMYEWGTTGINPAPNTPRLNPVGKNARLWNHKLAGGQRASKSIEYEFRASKIPVPLPTPRTAGIAKDAMAGKVQPKRRHIFYWKAPITEYGIPVHIKPVNAQALFIPLRGNPQTSDRRSIKRNYIMTKNTVTMVPGASLAGQFTKWWVTWWGTKGLGVIDGAAAVAVNTDAEQTVAASGRPRAARRYSRGTKAKTFTAQVSTARAEAKARLLVESKNRRLAAEAQQQAENTPGEVW